MYLQIRALSRTRISIEMSYAKATIETLVSRLLFKQQQKAVPVVPCRCSNATRHTVLLYHRLLRSLVLGTHGFPYKLDYLVKKDT